MAIAPHQAALRTHSRIDLRLRRPIGVNLLSPAVRQYIRTLTPQFRGILQVSP